MLLLTPTSWVSKSELTTHLESSERRVITVGADAEAPRKFYSFTLPSVPGGLEVGVISSGVSSAVAAIVLANRELVVGHDLSLSYVDLDGGVPVVVQQLNGAFFEFVFVEADDEVIVVHELGVMRVTTNGVVRWEIDTDVITDWKTDERGYLVVQVMDRQPLVISLATGACSRATEA